MDDQTPKAIPTKKQSFIVEILTIASLIISTSYSFFSKSYIGWIITASIIIIYLYYQLTKKSSEDNISKFEQFKRKWKMNAERKRREKMEMENFERQRLQKQELKKEQELLDQDRLKQKELEIKNELITDKKNIKTKEKGENKELGLKEKTFAKSEYNKGLNIGKTKSRFDVLETGATKIDQFKSALSKDLSRNLMKTSERNIKEAENLSKSLVKVLNLEGIIDNVAKTLVVTAEKAVGLVIDTINEGGKEIFNTVFSDGKVDDKKVTQARENIASKAKAKHYIQKLREDKIIHGSVDKKREKSNVIKQLIEINKNKQKRTSKEMSSIQNQPIPASNQKRVGREM